MDVWESLEPSESTSSTSFCLGLSCAHLLARRCPIPELPLEEQLVLSLQPLPLGLGRGVSNLQGRARPAVAPCLAKAGPWGTLQGAERGGTWRGLAHHVAPGRCPLLLQQALSCAPWGSAGPSLAALAGPWCFLGRMR